MKRTVVILGLIALCLPLFSQDYLDASKPLEVRVKDLISKMTIDEKIEQMGNTVPAIPRLKVAEYDYWSEALHGVARLGTATVFPQAIALGSTWDPELMEKITTVISTEARAKANGTARKYLTFWSPTINLLRDPRWGREEEGYSEDPYLTGRMGVAFVKGMQGYDPKYVKAVSTIKHFAANNSEFNRHSGSSNMDERDLREYYLAAFKASVTEGRVQSLMGAYNALNGVPCCANPMLMTDILRTEWGFDGFTVSDCGAIDNIYSSHRYVPTAEEAAALSVKAGTDINCGRTYQFALKNALAKNLLAEADIDRALFRAFRARFRLGEFDPAELVPYRSIPFSKLDAPEHRDLALLAARKAIVLLKNDTNILPLDMTKLKSIAVVGPNAARAIFGGYSGSPSFSVSVLDGIRARAKAPRDAFPKMEAESLNAQNGVQTEECREGGLNVGYINNGDWMSFTQLDFADGAAAIELRTACLQTAGVIEVYLDGPDGKKLAELPVPVTGDWQTWQTISAPVNAGATGVHDLYFKFTGPGGGYLFNINWFRFTPKNTAYRPSVVSGVSIRYAEGCAVGGSDEADIAAAADLARRSDVALVVVGTDLQVSDEGRDRRDIGLPGVQEKLVRAVYQANPKTVVVLVNGQRLAINWIQENVPGILCAWYDGQAQGTAIADALFGDVNPGAKLTTTWFKGLEGIPKIDDYNLRPAASPSASGGRTYWYFTGPVLYPFGHGLSYTSFAYSDLRLVGSAAVGSTIDISLSVANSGKREGDEVVQLYIHNNDPKEKLPQKKLVGFKRVTLKPGGKTKVVFSLAVTGESLGYWNAAAHAFTLNPGAIDVMVGSSSADIRLKGKLTVTAGKK
jgi:beta-glucosidase